MSNDGGSTGNVGSPQSEGGNEYVLTKDWSGEHERLDMLEATVDEFSVAALREAGFKEGSRCLEIGAGSGSLARWLSQETGDPTLVTATDIDPRLLSPLADEGITVVQHDVISDDFPQGSFDFIHARAVLEHVVQREDVLQRIVPWLAPDGVLVIVDCASYPVFTSQNRIYLAAMRAWVDVLVLTGTDYEWTRTFPEPLQRYGYRDVGAKAMVPAMQGGSPMARFWSLTLETLRGRILAANLLSGDAIDEAQSLLADPDFWDLGPGFVAAWGRRPS